MLITSLATKVMGDKRLTTSVRVAYLTAYFSIGCVAAIVAQRWALRQLNTYHGWLKEAHAKKKSWKTVVWGLLMKHTFVRGGKLGGTYVYQSTLPTLPLPQLGDTVERYLASMSPILNKEEMAECRQLAENFKKEEGPQLQKWLKLKWWTSTNYLNDWWLNFHYLRGRDPLPINTNWYGVCAEKFRPTQDMAARAASFVYGAMKVKRSLENETFEPLSIGGVAPLCMAQYQKAFSVTRVPGREQDVLEQAEPSESKHIAVLYNGCFYKLSCYSPNTNNLLSPLQLYQAIKGIIDAKDVPNDAEAKMCALTTMNRTEWSEVRDNHFMANHYNKERLEIIEKAAFTLCLDAYVPKDLSDEGKRLLCGAGKDTPVNVWCDKSITVVIDGTCQAAVHVEHTWGDAPAMSHILEVVNNQELFKTNYNEDGTIKETKDDKEKKACGKFKVYPAERIKFQMDSKLEKIITKAQDEHLACVEELDFFTLKFDHYGKNIPKLAKCSPDSWIQMSFQLAYWRDQGRFDQTYEASTTRLFGLGRTETVRSACDGSAKFVQLMEDPIASKEDRLKALQAACNYHQNLAQDAMIGKGCDRHLFGLYVVSVGKSIDSPFLKFALGRKWKLTTSQTSNQQTRDPGTKNEDLYRTPNGGFAPAADDGYGISYVPYQKSFFFNISAKNIKVNTGANKLGMQIEKALQEMAALVDKPAEKKESVF